MRILVPTHHFTDNPTCGVDIGIWNFVKYLAEFGNSVYVVTTSLSLRYETRKSLKKKGINIYKVYNYKNHHLDETEAFVTFLFSCFLRIFLKFDWIFIIDEARTPFSRFKLGAKLAARVIRPKTKEVEKFKGDDWEYDRKRKNIAEGVDSDKRPVLYRAIMFFAVRVWYRIFPIKVSAENADLLFCEGGETLRYCKKIGRKNAIYLPLGVEDYRIDKQEGEIETNGHFVYLFVGRILRMKGIYYLIDAFKQLSHMYPDVRLWIIGKANGEYKDRLVAELRGYEDKIKFFGEKNRDEIFKYMKSSHVVVDPMIWANFSSVVLEALYCGKPTIAPLGGNAKDFIKDGFNGFLVDSRDISRLRERMEYFYTHYDEAKKIGERGKVYVKEHLTWRKVAKNVEQYMKSSL